MSQYIQFFIRHNDDFLPIGTYSRSSEIYQMADFDVPYEKIHAINSDTLGAWKRGAEDQIKQIQKCISTRKEFIEMTMQSNNPLDEKMEYVGDVYNEIAYMKEEIENARDAIKYYEFLDTLIGEAEETKYNDDENGVHLDPAQYIYVGIEVGYPTIDDVI